MSVEIRTVEPDDHGAIRDLVTDAFGQQGEADLVEALRTNGDVVQELVSVASGRIVGHVLFSRLAVEGHSARGVALAPLAVAEEFRRQGLGARLVEEGHRRLVVDGVALSVVLGDPAYYGRFGYRHDRAAGFASDYQGDALQALAFGDAPREGRLVYAKPFAGL